MTDLRDSLAQVQELLENYCIAKARKSSATSDEYLRFKNASADFMLANIHALLAMMEDHSPDAGKMGEDSARLDYIERTFSGMTNRERYLPVTMIWGKGANGRTLREACDKYMAKDAARAGERG
jgi:hypothetical protein